MLMLTHDLATWVSRRLGLPLIVGLLVCGGRVRADAPEAWPVRVSFSTPIGYTLGSERLHGFTWGFRAAAHAYLNERGGAFGGYAEFLWDTHMHSLSGLGFSTSFPVSRIELAEGGWATDWRVGGYGGWRWSGEDDDTRFGGGVFTELSLPLYLYDLRVGLHVDGTIHAGDWSATNIGLDLDFVSLIIFALAAWAAELW
jgi:hypothetical protein